jgi:aspartate carbamoyltransferase catalytic subunit
VRLFEAMGAGLVVVRHPSSGTPAWLARQLGSIGVLNAGDGMHEHPTQGLLDLLTLHDAWQGRFEGRRLAIVGDIAHSRVARSNALLLTMFGNEVRFAAPRTLLPAFAEQYGVKVFDRIEPALEGADVVMMLRIQNERLQGALLPSMREYSRTFGLNARRLALAAPNAIVMHPGPMNRGVEIDPLIADCERSVILDQVEAGVAVRMSVLYMLAAESGSQSSVLRLPKE